jgi:hypothetical protein
MFYFCFNSQNPKKLRLITGILKALLVIEKEKDWDQGCDWDQNVMEL